MARTSNEEFEAFFLLILKLFLTAYKAWTKRNKYITHFLQKQRPVERRSECFEDIWPYLSLRAAEKNQQGKSAQRSTDFKLKEAKTSIDQEFTHMSWWWLLQQTWWSLNSDKMLQWVFMLLHLQQLFFFLFLFLPMYVWA